MIDERGRASFSSYDRPETRARLERVMAPARIAEAERRAEAWRPVTGPYRQKGIGLWIRGEECADSVGSPD